MRIRRTFVVAAMLAVSLSALAQDDLLGKKQGGSSGSVGSSTSSGSAKSAPKSSQQSSAKEPAQSGTRWHRTDKQDDALARKPQSRSGTVRYGTANNMTGKAKSQERVVIRSSPSQEQVRSLRDQVRREDRVEINYANGGLRIGYHHWDSRWSDDRFWYPHYVFNPYNTVCVVSPWYYYPQLPAYISVNRITYMPPPDTWFFGEPYSWRRPSNRRFYDREDDYDRDYRDDRYDRRYSELDYALDSLVRAFEDGDRRSVDRLVPRNGQVTVSVDGNVTYGVHADDFYDMLVDAVESARTTAYAIEEVSLGNGEAQVIARHEYRDPWGQRVSVYHRLIFQDERGKAMIRYFRTGGTRFW